MDKIRELLKQLNASDELSEEIIKVLTGYKKQIEEEYNTKFRDRVEKAKKICIEAVEEEKEKIQRKVEIFLESRVNTVDRELQKRAAVNENESATTLKAVKRLLEGVGIGKLEDTEALKTLTTENVQLKKDCEILRVKTESLEAKASRANSIAMKVLERNKVLESKTETPVTESKEVTLSDLKKTSDPKTTRTVLVEHQKKTSIGPTSEPEIMAIAESIDGTP